MVGWHHQLNGRESEQTPGDSERPWGRKESDMTERLNKATGQAVPDSEVFWAPPVLCLAVHSSAGHASSGSRTGHSGEASIR